MNGGDKISRRGVTPAAAARAAARRIGSSNVCTYTACGGGFVWVFEEGLGDGKEFYVFVYVRYGGFGDCVCIMGPRFFK